MYGVEVEDRQLVQLAMLPVHVAHGLVQSTHEPFTTNFVLSAQLKQNVALEQEAQGKTQESQMRVETLR